MSTAHDQITRKVVEMYNQFPYPTYGNHEDYFGRFVAPCLRNVRPLRRILEAGCGTGCVTLDMARHLPHVEIVAFDLADASLAYARELMQVYGARNVMIQKRDFLAPNEDLRDFDFVLSMGVIHHLSDPTEGVRQVYQFLRPGGYAYIYLYASLGRRRLHDMREALSILNGDRLPERERAELGMRVQRSLSYGMLINTLLEHRRGHRGCLIPLVMRKAWRRIRGATARLLPGAEAEMIAIHDVLLHPHDTDYRFGDMYSMFAAQGFRFVKVAQGMPNSIHDLRLLPDLAGRAALLPRVEQYRLIELFVEPRGFGFLVQKPE